MVSKLKRPQHRTVENLCQLYIWQETDNQNIQRTQKTKLPKNQSPNKEIENDWTEPFQKKSKCSKTKNKKKCSPSLSTKNTQIIK
jgi:hypothetical protein